jgi:hypothetical protein
MSYDHQALNHNIILALFTCTERVFYPPTLQHMFPLACVAKTIKIEIRKSTKDIDALLCLQHYAQ